LKARSRTEIIGLILQAVEAEPLTCSKIMYQAMLNFKQATDYYSAVMIQQGLVKYLPLDRKYAITDKGRQFLTLFNETSNLLTAFHDDMADNNLQVKNQQTLPQHQDVTVHK
jgi:predicted transcriptional regulator